MTLVRYNANGTIDGDVRQRRLRHRVQFGGTPIADPGQQRRDGHDARRGRQHHRRRLRRLAVDGRRALHAAGVYNASAVCYAPHLIDYSARAVAVRPNGSIVLVGYRPRPPSVGRRPADRPARDRTASAPSVTLPATRQQHDGLRRLSSRPTASRSARTACTVDGLNHNGSRRSIPRCGGRFYDGVAALAGQPLRRRPRRTAPTSTSRRQRRVGAALHGERRLDATFNAAGAGMHRARSRGASSSEREPARHQAARDRRATPRASRSTRSPPTAACWWPASTRTAR